MRPRPKRRDMRPICQYWDPSEAIHFAMPDASHVCSQRLRDGPHYLVDVFMAGVISLRAKHVVDDFGSLVQVSPWH